tara:strand:+ start:1219 stop:2835 length:1617 start_codon:yes stop_codon:yes gene_type:complete
VTINKILLKYQKQVVSLYFIFLFLSCWRIIGDFGVTLDDEHYYINGLNTYFYVKNFFLSIFNNDIDLSYFKSRIKEWPIVFEFILVIFSKLLNSTEYEEIYLLSHRLNFIIFFLSLILFFKLILKRFENIFLSICAVTFLMFSPRIFAESFYNSRDIFFMSLFIFYIYWANEFIKRNNTINTVLFSFFSALLINTKVISLIPFGLFLILYFYNYLNTKNKFFKNYKRFILYLFFTIFFIFILWPYLWSNPFSNLFFAFKNIIKDHSAVTVVNYYFGSYYSSDMMAWHYRLVWFLITTPIFVLILFSIGFSYALLKLFNYLKQSLNDEFELNQKKFLDIFLLLTLILSFIIVVEFTKSKFGGWRHVYFLFPVIIYFSIYALNQLERIKFKKDIQYLIFFLISINLIYNLSWIIKNHPHQYVFFNIFSKNYALKNFDLDWWGISHKSSLEYILKNDKNIDIKVFAEGFTSLRDSYLYLKKEDRKRIILSDFKNSNYIINNKMKRIRVNNHLENNKEFKLYYELLIDKHAVTSIYKRKLIK